MAGSVLSSPRRRSWLRRILRRFRNRGTHPAGGYLKPSASTRGRALGTRTPATVTTVDCSSSYPPGGASEVVRGLISCLPASSYSERGSFTYVTDTRGGSGGQLGRADFTNRGGKTRWEEAQRAAMAGINLAVLDLVGLPDKSLEARAVRANALMTSLRIMRMGNWRPVFPFVTDMPSHREGEA